MTKLLKEALAKLSKLSPERQDELAALLLAEMEDEARWNESFAGSQDVLEKLADEALEEHKRGETRPFDETVFGDKE